METEQNQFGVNLANSSSRNARRKSDWYPTPTDVTLALIQFLKLPLDFDIWEPACGDGAVSKPLEMAGYCVTSTDLYEYGFGTSGIDFIKEDSPRGDFIITNPPFNQSEQFIERAASFHIEGFAFLFKSQYWHAKKRMEVFQKHRPAWVLPLTWRPDFCNGERGGSPTMECIWTVWLRGRTETHYCPLGRPNLNPAQ